MRPARHPLSRPAAVLALIAARAGILLAQPPAMVPANGPFQGLSASLTTVRQTEADLDGGGGFSVNRLLLRSGYELRREKAAGIEISLSYDLEDYDFAGRTVLESRDPWKTLHFVDLSVPVSWTTHETLSWRAAPTIGVSAEDGADWGDAVVYGAVVSVGRVFRPGLILGIGGGVFRDLEETDGFPFVMVRWRFADRWTLANPFRPGPAGPAGLELAYALGDEWDVGIGGAYRSYRFRLADDGPAPKGIGENQGIPVYARLSRAWSQQASLDLWLGAVVGGEIEIEDEDGNRIVRDDYDVAPVVAATFSIRY